MWIARPICLRLFGALHAAGGFARGLHGWQQEANQHGDDRDHHQQFDQRESRTPGTHRTTPSVAALYGDGNAFPAPDGTTSVGFEVRTHSSIPNRHDAYNRNFSAASLYSIVSYNMSLDYSAYYDFCTQLELDRSAAGIAQVEEIGRTIVRTSPVVADANEDRRHPPIKPRPGFQHTDTRRIAQGEAGSPRCGKE